MQEQELDQLRRLLVFYRSEHVAPDDKRTDRLIVTLIGHVKQEIETEKQREQRRAGYST